MGIYDREYYRGEARGPNWFTAAAPVCRTIILINVAVYLAEHLHLVDGEMLSRWFDATWYGIFRQGRIWQLLTSTFRHDDLFHLLVNMLGLWVVGREMEAMYGSREFLAFYLGAAVFSTLVWAACAALSHSNSHMLGASGAVLATVVLFAMWYPRRELMLMFVIPIEIWLLVSLFIGYQVFMLLHRDSWAIAVESHLAGAAYGFAYKKFDLRWSRLGWTRRARPRLRVVSPEPRERSAVRPSGPTWSPDPASPLKPSGTAVLPEEQLDARLDEVLAKIAREGRAGLTDEENRVLQEASLRAEPPERTALNPAEAGLSVREARPDDLDTLVEFNARLALETEAKSLDRAVLERGTRQALADPDRLRYWVCADGAGGTVVGQAAVTREWSDWRNGWLWWFQSVYVRPDARGRGVFRRLHAAIRDAALAEGDVVGLRLYVEDNNSRAQATYRALGMGPGNYQVYEEIWPDRFGGRG